MDRIVQRSSWFLDLKYRTTGNFCSVQILHFLWTCWWMWNKNCENSTKELSWRWPSIVISRSLPCASSAARWTFDTPCVSTKSEWRTLSSWFSVETMVKATKPTVIAGPLFLATKCLAWRKLASRLIFHWHEDSADKHDTQRLGQCRILLIRK